MLQFLFLKEIGKIMNVSLLHNPLPLSLNDKGQVSFRCNQMFRVHGSRDRVSGMFCFPSRMPGLPLGRWRINFYCSEGIHQSQV